MGSSEHFALCRTRYRRSYESLGRSPRPQTRPPLGVEPEQEGNRYASQNCNFDGCRGPELDVKPLLLIARMDIGLAASRSFRAARPGPPAPSRRAGSRHRRRRVSRRRGGRDHPSGTREQQALTPGRPQRKRKWKPRSIRPAPQPLGILRQDLEHAPSHGVVLVKPVQGQARREQAGDDVAERVYPV